ncbi:hypothetical protein XA68_12933 [Ophiocordyceps unilateralis]|uniref:Uncharacterized protein n=1 Tax=Ophiocordyceps unilateralis TaxID=268505 RepID=A0A2A9PCR9_OPHUN|nr:hypothetical protein XA68_12933 [Ophiocordyceps unilateralis]
MTAAGAGAAALGIGIYYRGRGNDASKEEKPSRHSAHAKRDLGLEGAAVGGNAIVGSTELGAQRSASERGSGSPAPREKLPSGGVGGGEGAGGSSARKAQFPVGGSGQNFGGEKSKASEPTSGAPNPGVLDHIRDVFGPGEKPGVNPVDEGGVRDTRGASKMGSELPSKKRAPPA